MEFVLWFRLAAYEYGTIPFSSHVDVESKYSLAYTHACTLVRIYEFDIINRIPTTFSMIYERRWIGL